MVNHFGTLGGVAFCITWTRRVNRCAVSNEFGSLVDSTIKQPKKCLVNSWSDCDWTDKNISRHCSNHGSPIGISMNVWSVHTNEKFLLINCSSISFKINSILPSICMGLVLVDWADVTVSVSIFRATNVCGGRQLTSQKLRRMPLTDVDTPVASRI